MAHDASTAQTRRALVAASLLFAGYASAAFDIALGEIDVRSGPGEPLDATIALAGTDALSPACIFVSRGAAEDGPFVTKASVALFEAAGTRFLRLKSADPIGDPATKLRMVVRCPGQASVAYREYRALFEPRLQVTSPLTARVAPAAPARDSAATFPIHAGDTLDSLAALIFPGNRAAQRAYVEAMRERNPALSALGGSEPLQAGTMLELPDLRSYAKGRRLVEPKTTLAATPRAVKTEMPRAVRPKAEAPPRPAIAAAPRVRASPPGGGFSLRLSSPEIDLSRSRGIDDGARARLRERLLMLDSDDQVAALLSLRDSLKRLEVRVAELQLKLSGMPPSAPPAVDKPQAAPKAAAPALPAPVQPVVPTVEPTPAKIATAPVAPATPVEPAPAKVATAPAAPAAPIEAAPKPVTKPAAAPSRPVPAPEGVGGLPNWLWGAVALLVVFAVAIVWWLARRRAGVPEAIAEEDALPPIAPEHAEPAQPPVEDFSHLDIDVDEPRPAVPRPAATRREIASDADLPTEVHGGDPAALRRRYIEERFPEIANRTIVLTDPDSIVKGARLFYEDGATPRAVELLQFATEENPSEQKTWLALFEIFRLERLTGQFAELAQRFQHHQGQHENWRKVQFFGREIDPGNALYRDLTVGIETIKFEVGKTPAAASFDPVTENWLNAPMDFQNEVLANELRNALMVQAGLTEDDLAPNPMPALRSVEMFTVA